MTDEEKKEKINQFSELFLEGLYWYSLFNFEEICNYILNNKESDCYEENY